MWGWERDCGICEVRRGLLEYVGLGEGLLEGWERIAGTLRIVWSLFLHRDELNVQWNKVNDSKQVAATSVENHHTLTKEVITPAPKEGDKAWQTEPPHVEEGMSSKTAPDNDAGGKGKLSEAIDMQEKGESEQ